MWSSPVFEHWIATGTIAVYFLGGKSVKIRARHFPVSFYVCVLKRCDDAGLRRWSDESMDDRSYWIHLHGRDNVYRKC